MGIGIRRESQLLKVVDGFYAAALEPSTWKPALDLWRSVGECAGANIIVANPQTVTLPLYVPVGPEEDPKLLPEYRDMLGRCPRFQALSPCIAGSVKCDWDHTSESEMNRNEFYAWHEGFGGLRYYIGGTLVNEPSLVIFSTLQRTRAQGHAQAREVEYFRLTTRHMARALEVARKLEFADVMAAAGVAAFNRLETGVFLVNAQCKVVYQNDVATRMLRARDGLSVTRANRLETLTDTGRHSVMTHVRAQLALESTASSTLLVPRLAGSAPYRLRITRLTLEAPPLWLSEPPVAAIFVDTREQVPPTERLRQKYRLTPQELRLALHLVDGQTVKQIAESTERSVSTLRSQLSSLLQKTGCRRQAELVRLVTLETR